MRYMSAVVAVALSTIIMAAGSSVAQAPQSGPKSGLSPWYGAYKLAHLDPAYDINLDVIHYSGVSTAAVSIAIFVNPDGQCPSSMHEDFCFELQSKADERGFVDVDVSGVEMTRLGISGQETLEATFRLPGDRRDRLLRLTNTLNWVAAAIHHPQRGYDYDGMAQRGPNLCEQTACTNDVFLDLRRHPEKYSPKVDAGYVANMVNLPNLIAQSHQGREEFQPGSGNTPRSLASDAWVILEETGENLGEVSFSQSGTQLSANGRLRGFFETSEDHETIFTNVTSTAEAIAFDLVTYAGQSGESKHGRLLIELPAYAPGDPRGTLIVGEDILLVSLVRPLQGAAPSATTDIPAIGIYSLNYSLRNVPEGRTIRLRGSSSRSAAVTGELPANSSNLQIMTCDDTIYRIDTLTFEQADQHTRQEMLSRTWCQVTDGRIAGWLPGHYLRPKPN